MNEQVRIESKVTNRTDSLTLGHSMFGSFDRSLIEG